MNFVKTGGTHMSKGGYSKKGLFGNVTHYDSKGKKIGKSRNLRKKKTAGEMSVILRII